MNAKLTDGRIVELKESDFNPVGQIYWYHGGDERIVRGKRKERK